MFCDYHMLFFFRYEIIGYNRKLPDECGGIERFCYSAKGNGPYFVVVEVHLHERIFKMSCHKEGKKKPNCSQHLISLKIHDILKYSGLSAQLISHSPRLRTYLPCQDKGQLQNMSQWKARNLTRWLVENWVLIYPKSPLPTSRKILCLYNFIWFPVESHDSF